MFAVQNIVSITDFRQNLAHWLDQVKTNTPLLLVQHSQPKAVLIDPEYLEYLERYANGYYDEGDVAELKRAISKKEPFIPFDPEKYL